MKFIEKALSWNQINSSHRLMTLIVITLGILNFFFGEIVSAGGGFGWDGVNYANMTRYLGSMISEGQLSNYYAQRILPSALVRGMLLIVGAAFNDINIIRGFECYNLILLIALSWLWKRLSDNFSVSLGGRWLGFCGLFLSFMCSKNTFYYPVLTDVTALLVGMLALLFYVEKRPIALLATTIVGAFAWQISGICGALLLIFPRTTLPIEVISPAIPAYFIDSVKVFRMIKFGWIVLLILSIIGVVCLSGPEKEVLLRLPYLGSLLTGLPSLVGLIIILAILAGSALFFKVVVSNLRKTHFILVVLAIAAVLIPWSIVREIANPSVVNISGFKNIIYASLLPPNGKFLLPLVTLISYWGPVVLLLILNWKAFCIEARKLGAGFMSIIGLNLFLGLPTEPRFVIYAWPFFVLGAVLALEGKNRSANFKYVFAVLTILYGQFWMKINLAPWIGDDYGHLLEFPKQIYFMHLGMWMSWWSYSLQLGAIILSILWLRTTMCSNKPL